MFLSIPPCEKYRLKLKTTQTKIKKRGDFGAHPPALERCELLANASDMRLFYATMVSVVGRKSTATLLVLSTRRNLVLSSTAALVSLFTSTSPSSSLAFALASSSPPPALRYKTSIALCAAVADESSSPLCLNPTNDDTSARKIMDEPQDTGYLSAQDAAALDAELMSAPGFSLEQLMELAGLAVAEAVYDVVVVGSEDYTAGAKKEKKNVLLVCGPGNNGGDGLVAARHLVHFGLTATIVYPKRSTKSHFINLVKQCEDLGIPILDAVPMELSFDGIVDAVFGFSFSGSPPREPYATAIASMVELQQRHKSILISVDVPSGWSVNGIDDDSSTDATNDAFLQSDVLISLTVPKLFAKKFRGRHFIGGRFLPPKLAEKYGIRIPPYPGLRHSMEVMKMNDNMRAKSGGATADSEDWAAQYQAYLDGKEVASTMKCDQQLSPMTTDSPYLDEESWAVQYAKYCEEQERDLFG